MNQTSMPINDRLPANAGRKKTATRRKKADEFATSFHASGIIATESRPKSEALSLFFTQFSDEIDHLVKDIPDSDIRCTHSFDKNNHRFTFKIKGAGVIELNMLGERR